MGLTVDSGGTEVLVTGSTEAPDFPATTGGAQSSYGGGGPIPLAVPILDGDPRPVARRHGANRRCSDFILEPGETAPVIPELAKPHFLPAHAPWPGRAVHRARRGDLHDPERHDFVRDDLARRSGTGRQRVFRVRLGACRPARHALGCQAHGDPRRPVRPSLSTHPIHVGDSFPDVPRGQPLLSVRRGACSITTSRPGAGMATIVPISPSPGRRWRSSSSRASTEGAISRRTALASSPTFPAFPRSDSRTGSSSSSTRASPADVETATTVPTTRSPAPRWPCFSSRPSKAQTTFLRPAPPFSATFPARRRMRTGSARSRAAQITGGCGDGNYCPDNPNTRGQMAVFLVKTFGLQIYGP